MVDRTKWWLGLGVAFLLTSFLVSAMLTYQAAYHKLPERPTRLTLEAVELVSALKDAETGQRGFLLSGQDEYLEPYDASLPLIARSTRALAKLTPDGDDRVAGLTRLAAAKLDELRDTIAVRRTLPSAQGIDILRGKKVMDDIRALAARIAREEDHRLSVETAVQSAFSTFAIAVILVVFCTFIAMRR